MVLLFLSLFIIVIAFLWWLQRRHVSFSKRVLAGIVLGLATGALFQFGLNQEQLNTLLPWANLIGDGYIRLLQMIVIPLIFISVLSAIIKIDHQEKGVGTISLRIISVLIGTAIIAAIIGITVTNLSGLSMDGIYNGAAEIAQSDLLQQRSAELANHSFAERLSNLIPTNIFQDLAGSRSTSTIGVVIFSALLGIVARKMKRKQPESFTFFKNMVTSLHDVIMQLIKFVLRLTPYGVAALTIRIAAESDASQILKLGYFILASYLAIIIMLIIHLIILMAVGVHPGSYLKKAFPALIFAFTSRSSVGTIPINTQTQISQFGVKEGIANLAATFGATIGQNGCAALYPAMLAVMIAPTAGIDPTNIRFLLELILVIAVSSFGVAGVGGGATFAALMVLSTMNLPVGLVGLLISVEPLIDMGRTTLNVNGSIVAGIVTNKLSKENQTSEPAG
ncbi:MAG: cation:dicarboxylase symporter family transporter [Bacteroidales bacterium]